MTDKTKHEQTGLEKLFAAILLVVFGGIVLHAPFSVLLGSLLPDYALLFKAWKDSLLVLNSPEFFTPIVTQYQPIIHLELTLQRA